jgi:probable FeS assembly SUF system protein SufT
MQRERTLSREVTATQIPAGTKQKLAAGAIVFIHQTLGGSYTVQTDFGLFRIDNQDADAIGEQVLDAAVKSSTLTDGAPDPETIWDQLRKVFDPEIPVNIVDLGLVYSMEVGKLPDNGGYKVDVAMTLTAPGCGMGPVLAQDVQNRVLALEGVDDVAVELVWDPPWNQGMMTEAAKLQLGLM